MKNKKNDFSMTFYNKDEMVLFLAFVHDTEKAIKWINNLFEQGKIKGGHTCWTHAMVYNRHTREKIIRITNK